MCTVKQSVVQLVFFGLFSRGEKYLIWTEFSSRSFISTEDRNEKQMSPVKSGP